MTYVLLGVSAILVSFSLTILVAMLSYDNKTSKINRRVGRLATNSDRHWESIRILSKLQDQLDEKIREHDKKIVALNDNIFLVEREVMIEKQKSDKSLAKKEQLSI